MIGLRGSTSSTLRLCKCGFNRLAFSPDYQQQAPDRNRQDGTDGSVKYAELPTNSHAKDQIVL